MKKALYRSILLATSAATAGMAAPAVIAQGEGLQLEEIVVTARRREERLQDVPVSMTVLDQQQLNDAFITNASDIAKYTPSLQTNTRFGADSSTFAIRGFSQELRTTSSVGVYFADVVAPRGANTTQSGNGAGPGAFFDLENVQVLKGPQGTLFGRNTTGGAVMLTPTKPTEEFEGYAEVSAGNYDMHRLQGVVNIPVADSFRVRLGVNHQKRDGHLENISDIGPDDFADVDFTTFRGSAVWDITDNLENYTIVRWTESENNGSPYSLFACDPSSGKPFGDICQADLDQRRANGNDGFYDVHNFVPDSKSEIERKQVINKTTWTVNDNLTVKNIFSYAKFDSEQNFALYGTNWQLPVFDPQSGQPVGSQHLLFQMVGSTDFQPTTDQDTLVEELQFQGTAFDERLTWQGGLYYEKSEADSPYGSQNPSTISCDLSTVDSANPADFRCNNMLVALGAFQQSQGQVPQVPAMRQGGSMLVAPGEVEYENKAVYAQGTWEFNHQWSLSAGLRYTDDETSGWTRESVYYFPGSVLGGYFPPGDSTTETRTPETSSEEPTWMVGLDYQMTRDVLLYGKYSRGYRQGSVNLASVDEWDTHGPEQVDTYEVGAKTSFEGAVSGTFNVAAFYNDFTDQQVQFGYLRDNGVGTTSILNAGSSTLWGIEADGSLQLTDNFRLNASYSYLDTEVDELEIPQPPYPDGVAQFSGTTTAEGEPLSYAPEHQLVVTASYMLPVDPELGDMVASATYTYTDEMQAVSQATSPLATLPSYELVNLNFNWRQVAGSQVDLALFATNVFDEEYETYLTGNWSSGLEVGRVGQPRMYGARLKYNF